MPDPLPEQYDFTVPGVGTLTFLDETSSEEPPVDDNAAEYSYPRIIGVEVVDAGPGPRELRLSGWIHAASSAALRTRLAEIETYRRVLGTLSIRGGEDTWYNVRITGKPGYSGRIPPQADGTVHCRYSIAFQELDQTAPA